MLSSKKISYENIGGWVINKNYYRVNNKYLALVLFFLDTIFSKLFKKRPLPANIKNILIIRLEQIGDVILTTSFFRELKKNYKNVEITVLCRTLTKDLFKLIPRVDKIKILNTPWLSRNDSEGYFKILKFIKKHYKSYDLVFDLHPDPRNLILARFLGKYTIAYDIRGFKFLIDKVIKWDFEKVKHIVDRYLYILKELGLKIEKNDLEIILDKNIMNTVIEKVNNIIPNLDTKKIDTKKKRILIHPISGREEKNISWKKWKEIIKKESEKGNIIFIGGSKQDKQIIEKNLGDIIDNIKVYNIAGFFKLLEYIHFIKLIDFIYSVDTFVVHVASALKKNIKTFYIATNEKERGYYKI